MTIKEVEERTGLTRSNVRFYEKEKLIAPSRNENNGYRDYSERDVEDIKKIAYLRTLGISVEDIRNVISEKTTLYEVVARQSEILEVHITEMNKAKAMCRRMLQTDNINYAELQVEQYVTELEGYWDENQQVFKLDSVCFLYMWGSFITWAAITVCCLVIGILFYRELPPEIPVQWSGGAAASLVDRKFIFAYPAVCIAIRYLLRPLIYAKLQMYNHYGKIIAEYLTSYLCFIALSTEVFSILFIYGVVKNIAAVLFVDTAVLIGILIMGMIRCTRMELRG